MRLTVFNGSPRGKGSNSKLFLEHFLIAAEGRATVFCCKPLGPVDVGAADTVQRSI